MNGHLFGWSGRPGIDRCACGTERELVTRERAPFGSVWLFRGGVASALAIGTGRLPPCPIVRSCAA